MQEEFHADLINDTWVYKRYYGWNNLTSNVWLPSLSELVGIDPNAYADWSGCYKSAMQGLNVSVNYWTDVNGGAQFAYFVPYNTSGGGQKIWNTCGQENAWIRSPYCGTSPHAWVIIETAIFDSATNSVATSTYAVHPAMLHSFKVSFCLYPPYVSVLP